MTTIVDQLHEGPAGTVRLAAAGDAGAFDQLVAVHSADMARVAYVICSDVTLAQEVTQGSRISFYRGPVVSQDKPNVGPAIWTVASDGSAPRPVVETGHATWWDWPPLP